MFKGIATALITPLNDNLTINYDLFAKLCQEQSDNGVKALFVHGTTGGGTTLTLEEKIKLLNVTNDNVSKDVLIYSSISNNDTSQALHEVSEIKAKAKRLDGILLLTPYYNKANENGMLQHFLTIIEHANLPTILYHIPGRCGVGISYNVLNKLHVHPLVTGIKYADDNLEYLQQIILDFQNEQFCVYLGEDALYYSGVKLGVDGLISASTNILLKEFIKVERNDKKSKQVFKKMLPLVQNLFEEVNPIAITYAYALIHNENANYRLPLCEPSTGLKQKIKQGVIDNGLCN